jgi:Mrp family chromosome partitioning ATPase
LKNLEARSVRAPAPKAVAKKAEPVAVTTAPVSEKESRPVSPELPAPDPSRSWSAEPPFVLPAIAKTEIAEPEPPFTVPPKVDPPAVPRRVDVTTQEFGFGVSLSLPSIEIPARPKPPEALPTRPACALERAVRRTLRDPGRAPPLQEMAERLQRDIAHNECKTLVFVGVGPVSSTQETILYAATLLAEREQECVLLVDADAARQALTIGVEYDNQRGLTELLGNDDPPRSYCQLTAVGRLSFLPVGLARHADLSTAGPRLEQVVERLTTEFSCLLIDGGRTGDLAATALARQAAATYLVVQLGAVETSEAQAALRDFRAAGARVLGSIAT